MSEACAPWAPDLLTGLGPRHQIGEGNIAENTAPDSDADFTVKSEKSDAKAFDTLGEDSTTIYEEHNNSISKMQTSLDKRMSNQEQVTDVLINDIRDLQKGDVTVSNQINFLFGLIRELEQKNGERFDIWERINKDLGIKFQDLSRSLAEQIQEFVTLQGEQSGLKNEVLTIIENREKRPEEESKQIATQFASWQKEGVGSETMAKVLHCLHNLNTRVDNQEAANKELERVFKEKEAQMEDLSKRANALLQELLLLQSLVDARESMENERLHALKQKFEIQQKSIEAEVKRFEQLRHHAASLHALFKKMMVMVKEKEKAEQDKENAWNALKQNFKKQCELLKVTVEEVERLRGCAITTNARLNKLEDMHERNVKAEHHNDNVQPMGGSSF
jgi:chromosome segregation ATPase